MLSCRLGNSITCKAHEYYKTVNANANKLISPYKNLFMYWSKYEILQLKSIKCHILVLNLFLYFIFLATRHWLVRSKHCQSVHVRSISCKKWASLLNRSSRGWKINLITNKYRNTLQHPTHRQFAYQIDSNARTSRSHHYSIFYWPTTITHPFKINQIPSQACQENIIQCNSIGRVSWSQEINFIFITQISSLLYVRQNEKSKQQRNTAFIYRTDLKQHIPFKNHILPGRSQQQHHNMLTWFD